uniref:Uncharacterized protein n=1 Tax=uncultured bacterium CBNPD1 BAC clone 1664 TaxID=417310 RepID=B1N6N6_9BACT|nr:conserved hypothetical protein [uncultured bacterium CBNPD1 BAC clone 1664]
MLLGDLMGEGGGDAVEGECGVNHRPEGRGLQGADHLFLVLPRADGDALHGDVLGHDQGGRRLAGETRQDADQRDVAADPGGGDRLGEGAGPADLHHDVDAPAAGEGGGGGAPFRGLAIVDQVVRAEGPEPFQLLVGGGGGDDRRAGRLGQLEGEDRDPARPLGQDDVAGLDPRLDHQGAPGGEGRAGQGRRLGEGPAGGHAGEGPGRHGDELRREAVGVVAGNADEAFQGRAARLPVGEEGREDPVPGGEARDALAHSDHLAGPVGHGDAPVGGGQHAGDDGEVVEVQRAGADRRRAGPALR